MTMKRLNRLLALSCVGLLTGICSTAARADLTNDFLTSFTVTNPSTGVFDFSFTGANPIDNGSGVINATANGGGIWTMTSMSGTSGGVAINGLLPINTYPFSLGLNDNLLYYPAVIQPTDAGPGYLDIDGFSYSLANGGSINIYYGVFGDNDPEVYNLISGVAPPNPAALTPEPGSLALAATGMLGLVGLTMARRGRMVRAAVCRS